MSIGSCTPCQSPAISAYAPRARPNSDRNDTAGPVKEPTLKVAADFKPDPLRLLDIQA